MAYFADNPNCPSNFLSGAGFQFSLKKLPGVSFYCQSANVPSQNLAVAMQATRFNTIPEPGDEVNYDDLTVRFLVDEDLKNYRSIHNWIRYLGHPESDQDWTTYADGESYQEKQYSDGILFVLDSNFNRKFKIYFKDLFPVSLSGLNFDSTYTDTEYFAVDATFKFTIFDIEEVGATGFFTQADPPTVSISHTVDSNNNVILTWSSQNASNVIIDQGVGEASLFGTDTILAANVDSRMSNGTLIYTATATGRGGTATAFTTVTIGTPVTNATIVNIAVIDESSEQNLVGMESKWTSFRTTYPDRNFYLLQPNNCTDYDALMCPPNFMEETDPSTITNVCGSTTMLWTTLQANNTGSHRGYTNNSWSTFMNTYAYSRVPQSGLLSSQPDPYGVKTDSYVVNFPQTGTYQINAAADNSGTVTIDGTTFTAAGFSDTNVAVGTISLTAGDHTITLTQQNQSTSTDTFSGNPVGLAVTITYNSSGSNIIGDANFGHYTSTSQGRVETQPYNSSTQETDFSNINSYGVFIAGLETGCGDLSDMITLFTPGNAARTSVLNYINAGGVFWFKSEWVGGGCANHANVNTILTLLGTNIRINGESATSGQLEATTVAISAGFPETIFHNATGLFDNGTPLYQVAGTTSAAWAYEKIGNGAIVCSSDVNTYQGGFGPANNLITPTKFPPDEMYTGLRRLPFI
jgi:hypothetical protein